MSYRTPTRTALTVGLLAAVMTAGAAEWTGFRGTAGSAVSEEKGLPVKWSKTEGLRWKIDLPGRGLSNPVIAGGRIFLTACSGYRERRLHVLCFDEASGKKLWERQFTATGSTNCHPTTSMAAPTPATDGKAVYALFATGDLAALDRDGTLLWYRSLVGDYPRLTNQVGMAVSPVLAGNVLLLAMDNAGDSFAAGIDTKNGKNIWKVDRPREINWVTPLLFNSAGRQAALFADSARRRRSIRKRGKCAGVRGGGTAGNHLSNTGQRRAVRPRQSGPRPEAAPGRQCPRGGLAGR